MFDIDRVKFYASVTKHSFVKPGDYNYIHARFCRATGLHTEFYWQAAQAIEKYLKAALVANGGKSDYGHRIGDMLVDLNGTLGEHGVNDLSKPDKLNSELWTDKPLERMMWKLAEFGDPNSRYGLTSYQNDGWDIFVFDKLVWEIRRRSVGMKWVIGTDWIDETIPEFNGQSLGSVIMSRPDYQARPITIPKVDFSTIGQSFDDALHSWNLMFQRNPEDISKAPPRTVAARIGGFGNSVLPMYLSMAEKSAQSDKAKAAEVAFRIEWILDKIYFPKGMRKEIEEILAKVKVHI